MRAAYEADTEVTIMQRRSRLARRPQDGMIAGVLAGIGAAYDIDPTLLRIGVVALAVITGGMPLIVLYLIAAVIMPREDDTPGIDSVRHGVDDLIDRGKSFYGETRRVIDRRSEPDLRETQPGFGSGQSMEPPSGSMGSATMPPPPVSPSSVEPGSSRQP